MNYKMILPNIFTKKYHRSIMISIEVSLNSGKLLAKKPILRIYV